MPKKKKPKTLKIVEPKKKLKSKKPTTKKKVPKTLRIKEPSKPKPKKKMPKTLRIKEPEKPKPKPKKKMPKTLRIVDPSKKKIIKKCDRCGHIDRIFKPEKYRKLGSGNYCLDCIDFAKGDLDYDPADYYPNQKIDMLDYYRSYDI